MLRILFAFVVLAGPSLHAQVQTGPDCSIQDAFATGDTMWLLCRDGHVLTNEEPGGRWEQRDLPAEQQLRAVRFLDAQLGFVAGDGGTLLETTDGGVEWREVETPTGENLTSIHSIGESVWVAGWGGVILHSDDGGQSWAQQPTNTAQGLDDIQFTDPTHGWAVGWVGTILRTTDSGASWEQVRAPDVHWSLNGVHFVDHDSGFVVGFGGQIARTRDGGETWEVQPRLVTRTLTSVFFDEQGRGWITSADGVLMSEDGGDTWQNLPIEERLFLVRVVERDNSLWAVGARDLLKQEDTGSWRKTASFVGGFLADLESSEQS